MNEQKYELILKSKFMKEKSKSLKEHLDFATPYSRLKFFGRMWKENGISKIEMFYRDKPN